MTKKKCKHCERTLIGAQRKFCSPECKVADFKGCKSKWKVVREILDNYELYRKMWTE